ncbi:MAG: PAS domain-containing protein [Deltaproteobacteria bacterium]|nr:PAS domain-containing protein [Deltaproteobacteria bacterium]
MRKRLGDYLSPAAKYWIFLVGIISIIFTVIFGSFIASYLNLAPEDKILVQRLFDKLIPFPFLGSMILIVIICTLVSLIFNYYIIPVLRMAEQTRLITSVNPDHRITTKGARELKQLAETINESADAYQRLQTEIDDKIQSKNLALKQERNRLAALMSELPNGVVVCNYDGTILLYNRKAQEMLGHEPVSNNTETELGGSVGLGRSIFGVLDREPIVHTLEVMNHSFAHGEVKPALGLMTKLCGQRFIRVNMAAISNQESDNNQISGFVLTLEDITGEIDAEGARDRQLQGLIDAVQNSLGKIHSGISEICQMPGTGGDACDRHRNAIARVTDDLEQHLALARELYSQHRQAYGNRENVLAESLLAILKRSLHDRFGLAVETQLSHNCWLDIDSYSIVQAFTNLAGMLKSEHQIKQILLSLNKPSDNFIQLKITWSERGIPCASIRAWLEGPLFMDCDGTSSSPGTIIAMHSGAVHLGEKLTEQCNEIQVTLPMALTEQSGTLRSLVQPRPISYEFDLFHQPGQKALANIPLSKLSYVAFDTETTGLNPTEGDEIIQIGAVRIVNGRILPNEVVDQLVNPKRPVPKSSVAVHGISAELLESQPTIEELLPRFSEFVKGSVLVAHNAAFDMRFLQLKESATGIRFDNPVLDTLLLSSVVHPHQEGHSLDAIAERMNIKILGRHTALGDALVTAEVLLKLLPLLEAEGIVTLDDALRASEKSTYAKLKY